MASNTLFAATRLVTASLCFISRTEPISCIHYKRIETQSSIVRFATFVFPSSPRPLLSYNKLSPASTTGRCGRTSDRPRSRTGHPRRRPRIVPRAAHTTCLRARRRLACCCSRTWFRPPWEAGCCTGRTRGSRRKSRSAFCLLGVGGARVGRRGVNVEDTHKK